MSSARLVTTSAHFCSLCVFWTLSLVLREGGGWAVCRLPASRSWTSWAFLPRHHEWPSWLQGSTALKRSSPQGPLSWETQAGEDGEGFAGTKGRDRPWSPAGGWSPPLRPAGLQRPSTDRVSGAIPAGSGEGVQPGLVRPGEWALRTRGGPREGRGQRPGRPGAGMADGPSIPQDTAASVPPTPCLGRPVPCVCAPLASSRARSSLSPGGNMP